MSGGRTDDAALAVIDRLNSEKKAWSFEVVNHLVLESEVVVLGRLTVEDVAKMAFGTAAVSRDVSGKPASIGTDLKVAANDALARAARLFGVGLVFEQPERPVAAEDLVRETLSPDNRVTQKQLGAINGLSPPVSAGTRISGITGARASRVADRAR